MDISQKCFIKKSDLVSALSQGLDIPPIKLSQLKIASTVLDIIPINIAKHYQIVQRYLMLGVDSC